jgi:hypothetical protein
MSFRQQKSLARFQHKLEALLITSTALEIQAVLERRKKKRKMFGHHWARIFSPDLGRDV